MLENIENENEIEDGVFLLTDVGQFELKSFVRSALAHLQSLRRDVVTPETAGGVHFFLQEPDHFSCAAANFADGLRLQTIFLHHSQDVLDLEWGFINMPKRIFLQVFTAHVDVPVEHVTRGLRRHCHPWSSSEAFT